ncbi:MAG: hypothetical protein AAF632_02420 [Bacteroidota bacterium]
MKSSLFLITVLCLLATFVKAQSQTEAQQIERAMSSAPASVAEQATVMDWDSRKVLKEGSNGYICFPSFGGAPYPMCVEQGWIDFIDAMLSGEEKPPTPDQMVIGYWLQGAPPMSNEKPMATPEEAANHVIAPGDPHLAILFPDKAMLKGYPDNPDQGGPWVMFKDTPYVHLMVPAPAPSMAEAEVSNN